MLPIFVNTFSEFRTTHDGDLLVPDQVQVLTIKKLKLTRQAEYYQSFKEAFDKTTYSLNVGVSVPTETGQNIGGSFSGIYATMKRNMAKNESTMFITQLDYHAYTLIFEMSSEFDHIFKERLLSIHHAIEANLTELARYLAEMVIADYGTHVLSRVKIGAKIEQIDFFNTSIIKSGKHTLHDYSAAISNLFIEGIGINIGGGIKDKDKKDENLTLKESYSIINSYGGLDVNSLLAHSFDINPSKESKLTVESFVPLDVDGMLLYKLISERPIPEINVEAVVHFLQNATTLYYEKNLYPGCMDPSSRNFNYLANFDDEKSCENNTFESNTTFGGFFHKCSKNSQRDNADKCNSIHNMVHPITNKLACPNEYREMFLSTFFYIHPKEYWGWVNEKRIEIEIYWCMADFIDSKQGFLFGGLYSKNENNLVTGEPTCPKHFTPYSFALDVTVCLSRNFDRDEASEVKFGVSCLLDDQKCEDGFSRQLIDNYDGCDIYYCVRSEKFKQKLPEIYRPPYEDISALASMRKMYLPNDRTTENPLSKIHWSGIVGVIGCILASIALVILSIQLWIKSYVRNKNKKNAQGEELRHLHGESQRTEDTIL